MGKGGEEEPVASNEGLVTTSSQCFNPFRGILGPRPSVGWLCFSKLVSV